MTRPTEHFIIPDTQVKPGVPLDHLTAAGNYIVDRQPSTIIHLGDHFDMHSLSSYDEGTAKSEGARYQEDINAGLWGMDYLLTPIRALNAWRYRRGVKQYRPRMVFLIGNHEERIMRHVNKYPNLIGKLSYKDLELENLGWEVHDFLEMVVIDGVHYAHYFYNPNTGKPLGGVASTRLKNIGFSFTMGHQQGLDTAIRFLSNGQVHRGTIAGSFYQHDEGYKGPQGNDHFQGCLYKHEVKDGNYCLMELSLDYLMKEWL
jgi:hypothetical protein